MKLPNFDDFSLDKLKEKGQDLVNQVKSGELLEKVKSGLSSVKDHIHKKHDSAAEIKKSDKTESN